MMFRFSVEGGDEPRHRVFDYIFERIDAADEAPFSPDDAGVVDPLIGEVRTHVAGDQRGNRRKPQKNKHTYPRRPFRPKTPIATARPPE